MSQIPEKKHSKEELATLQVQQAMQQPQIASYYEKRRAPRWLVILNYVLAVIPPIWFIVIKMAGRDYFDMQDVYFLGYLVLVPLFVAVVVFLKYTLSRHNAVFAFIITFLGALFAGIVLTTDGNLKKEIKQLVMPKKQREAAQGSDTALDEITIESTKESRRRKRAVRLAEHSAVLNEITDQSPSEHVPESDLKNPQVAPSKVE